MSNVLSRKRMALLVSALLAVSLVIGGITYAEDTEPQVKELSLQEAIDLAVENNYDIKLARLDVKSANREFEAAEKKADDPKYDEPVTYELGQLKWVAPRGAEAALTIAKKTAEFTEKSTKLAVESAYYDVLKTKKLLEIKEDTLQYAKDQLDITQESYKLGTVAKGDVMAVEALVAGSEAEVTSARNDYDVAVMKLNEIIGLDIKTPLKLTDKFEFNNMEQINVNQVVEEALDNNVEIVRVKEEQAVKEKEFEVAKKYYVGGVTYYDKAEVAAEAADIKVKKQEVATRLVVEESYMTIKSLEKTAAYKQKEVEKQKEVLRITMLKYENGLATNQDVKKATLDYEGAKQDLAELIFKYNSLTSKFKYGLFTTGSATSF